MDTSIIIAASAVVWPAATYMFGRRHGGWYARQEIRKLKNGIACRDRKLSEAQGRIDIRNMWLDRRNKRIIELLAELAAAGKPDQPRDPITGRWMSKPTPDDGWIEWKGGERPVSSIDAVDVKFRSGGKAADNAGNFYWGHDHMSSDIIAYRIASEKEAA